MPDRTMEGLCAKWQKALDEHRQSVLQYAGLEFVPYAEPMTTAPESRVPNSAGMPAALEEIAELKQAVDSAYAAVQEHIRASGG